jgi:deoxyadenosine/deoxycytidine kinase
MPKIISFFSTLGAGKTTRAELLSGFLGVPFYSEKADSPFLGDMFSNKKNGFLNQLHFLYRDRNEILDKYKDNNDKYLIFDYHIAQVDVFSHFFLNPSEYQEFFQHYKYVIKKIPLPDLIIHLKIDIDLNMTRVKERGRTHEQITKRFMTITQARTQEHIANLKKKTNVLDIDASNDVINCLNSRLQVVREMVSCLLT